MYIMYNNVYFINCMEKTYLGNKVNGENNGDMSMISRTIECYSFLAFQC